MNAWELTFDEMTEREVEWQPDGRCATRCHRAIASAAVKKYQEWLASQCGPNPCDDCELKYDHGGHKGCDRRPKDGDVYRTEDTDPICEPFAFYEGQIQGYAKGLQERGK